MAMRPQSPPVPHCEAQWAARAILCPGWELCPGPILTIASQYRKSPVSSSCAQSAIIIFGCLEQDLMTPEALTQHWLSHLLGQVTLTHQHSRN
jgi:hypothetical protein